MLYPIMTTSRELIDLNGIWNFKLDHGTGFAEEWFQHPLQETLPMPVPASYNDLYEGTEFRDHIGWVWYEREIVVPDHFFHQRIVLRFGSVTHAARVYLNGQLVVEHKGGFTPFEAEINAFVSSGKNRLTVALNNIVDHTTLPVGNYQEEDVPGKGKVVTNEVPAVGLHLNFLALLSGGGRSHKTWEELKGVFTRERKPKMAAHMLRERWMAIPDFGYKQ